MLPPLSHFLTLNYLFGVWLLPQIVTGTLALIHPQDNVWHIVGTYYLILNTY